MNTSRTPARRVEENDVTEEIPPQVEQVEKIPQGAQVPPQGDQVLIVEGGNDILVVPPELSNRDIREALLDLAQVVTSQVDLSMDLRMNIVKSSMTYGLRNFVRMNRPIFLALRWERIPKHS